MDVSSISQASSVYTGQTNSAFQSWRQNFQALGSALQAGNLAGAQSAFANLMQNAPAALGAPNTNTSQNQTLTQDFNTLLGALQSGNLSDAQKAFATLKQDMAAMHQTHHHHHHQKSQGAAQTGSDTLATAAADNDGGRAGTGSTINASA